MEFRKLVWVLALALLLAACSTPTPTAAPPPTGVPEGYPPPNATLPAGYPVRPASGPTGYPPPAANVTVTYRNFEIVPAQLTIPVGATVLFFIADGLHEPYSTDAIANFDAGPNLGAGQWFMYTFKQAGTVTLLCRYHSNMKATIVVTP